MSRHRWGAAARYRAGLCVLLAPWLLGVLALIAIPAILSIALAFTVYDGLTPPVWHGLGNFRALARDSLFRIAVFNSLAFVALTVPLRVLISLGSRCS